MPNLISTEIERTGLDPFCIERLQERNLVDLSEGTVFEEYADSPGWVYARSQADSIDVWRIRPRELITVIRDGEYERATQ